MDDQENIIRILWSQIDLWRHNYNKSGDQADRDYCKKQLIELIEMLPSAAAIVEKIATCADCKKTFIVKHRGDICMRCASERRGIAQAEAEAKGGLKMSDFSRDWKKTGSYKHQLGPYYVRERIDSTWNAYVIVPVWDDDAMTWGVSQPCELITSVSLAKAKAACKRHARSHGTKDWWALAGQLWYQSGSK